MSRIIPIVVAPDGRVIADMDTTVYRLPPKKKLRTCDTAVLVLRETIRRRSSSSPRPPQPSSPWRAVR